MVALTITIGSMMAAVVLVAVAQSLRRASRTIETILHEELDPSEEDG